MSLVFSQTAKHCPFNACTTACNGLQENKPPQSRAPYGHRLTALSCPVMLSSMLLSLRCRTPIRLSAAFPTCSFSACGPLFEPRATSIFEPLVLARHFGAFPSYPWVLRRSRALRIAQCLESSPDLEETSHTSRRGWARLSRGCWSAEHL